MQAATPQAGGKNCGEEVAANPLVPTAQRLLRLCRGAHDCARADNVS